MPGSTPSRSPKNCYASLVPMSERQQLKLVRQLETCDKIGENSTNIKETSSLRPRSRSCNGRGETPLHRAAIKGDEELVIKLLEEGADPDVPDFAGWTPLHEACNHGWYGVALTLIQAGASINAKGFDDDTPLHDAAVNGHSKEQLPSTIHDIKEFANYQRLNLLVLIEHYNFMLVLLQLVRLLLERGADVQLRNKSGKTPCDVATPGLIPYLLKSQSFDKSDLERNELDESSGSTHEGDSTAISEIRQSPPQAKVDKSSRVTLRLHQVKKKPERSIIEQNSYNINIFHTPDSMEEKNNKEDVYEFKSSKEATPVRGNSTSPEVEKNNSESKNEKAGDVYSGTETEIPSVKRALSEIGDNDENEDESKKKKRKEGDGKDVGSLSKASASAGRVGTVRNINNNPEKVGKTSGHALNKTSGGIPSKTAASSLSGNQNSDRKSPSSPKNSSTVSNPNTSSNTNGKAELDQETDKSTSDSEKMDIGPKVPPLKIVIPQQTASEPEQGTRNGKNSTSRHHQALPYVVSSNSNDSDKDGQRSRSPSPTDSYKADEKKDPAIGMLSAEDQKGCLHQRVLRSAHRSGPGGNGENRAPESTVPRSSNGIGQSSNINTGGTLTVANNPTNAISVATTTPTDSPSPQSQNRSSPLPQTESSSSLIAAYAPTSSDSSSNNLNSSNFRTNSVTPNKLNGGSTSVSTITSEDKVPETNSETTLTPSQPAQSTPVPVELHPRKRKLKHNKEVKETPPPQVTTERCESASASTEIHPHEQPVKNCYQLFLDIRKQIERRRKGLFPVQPKPPQGFKDYLMNRCTYVLAGNASTRQIPSAPLPQNLSSPMKDLFTEQENERHRLRLQHVIEKEKLVLSVEQEILRVHGRAARALANQSLPFSACTILKDEEVYNLITPEQEEKDRNARSRYNGRLFLSWLQDVDDKWEKIKEAMLLRHHNEAESLHAVQKMDWEWKMKELGFCEFKSKPIILDNHVPMVHVSDDFDLLPA